MAFHSPDPRLRAIEKRNARIRALLFPTVTDKNFLWRQSEKFAFVMGVECLICIRRMFKASFE